VHSFISNFEVPTMAPWRRSPLSLRRQSPAPTPADRIPRGIGRAWLLALLGTVLVLAALQGACRHWGVSPAIQDDQRLWAAARDGMRRDDPNQVALVGTSRMRLDFDVPEFSHAMGGAPVAQLAVEASEGLLMFEDLSRDVHFRGLVVFDVAPWGVFGNMSVHDQASKDYLAYRAHEPWIAPLDARLREAAQLGFAFGKISYSALLGNLRSLRWPSPSAFIVNSDRSVCVDWSRTSAEQLRKPMRHMMTPGSCASPQQLRDNLIEFEAMIRRIESRGGRVALVVLPSTGPLGDAERMACPREQYWDVLAATTSAVTLNWMDDPRLRRFQCPDGSHLDMRDQAEFTRIVVEDLRGKLQAQYATAAGR
jgi:hypothetical protein